MPPRVDFQALLEHLVREGVEFVVVGGVGAVLRGAPITTFDLDIVSSRSPENVDVLLNALQHLNARYRTHPHVSLDATPFLGPGHIRLSTDLGPLDVLGEIGGGEDFASLSRESSALDVGGFEVRVLSLRALIRVKEAVARDKDRAVLPLLRKALEEEGSTD